MHQAWKPLCCLTLCSSLGLAGCQTMQTQELQASTEVSASAVTPATAHSPPSDSPQDYLPRSYLTDQALAADAVFHPPLEATEAQHHDLWERIREGFQYDLASHPKIRQDIDWYAERPRFLNGVQERARPYLHFIVEEIEQRGMPMELALLPAIESSFVPSARSPAAAAGIWQFTPGTGARFGLAQNAWYDGRLDVVASTHAALDYLELLAEQFNGDWGLALAAYNAGEMTIQRAIEKNTRLGKPTDFWSLDLPKETRAFFPRLLAISELIKNPDQYGFNLNPIPNEPYFKPVTVEEQIDLKEAARLAGIPAEEIKRLNPGFKRWATAPGSAQMVNVPAEVAEDFEEKLAANDDRLRVRLSQYEVRRGDTLGGIAQRLGVSSAALQQANHLKGTKLTPGQMLVVPVSPEQVAAAGPAEPKPQAKKTAAKKKGRIEYQVKAGDSLWLIAKAHKVSDKDIAKWNKINAKTTLQPGMTLIIYKG
jgi:membrane-bound lytic murein transglycosylase D